MNRRKREIEQLRSRIERLELTEAKLAEWVTVVEHRVDDLHLRQTTERLEPEVTP